MEMNTITQKLTAITGRLARLMPVSHRGGDTLLTPMGGIKVEGMDDADRILSSPGSDGCRILDGGILWCDGCDDVKHETLGDFRLWRIGAPLDSLRKVPGGWEATEAIVLEEITGRETIAQ